MTATSTAGATGGATITIAPEQAVTITASAMTVNAGQSITLTAAGQLDLDALQWVAVPSTAGSFNPPDGGQVTLTASPGIIQSVNLQVFAYAADPDDGVVALGEINLIAQAQ